MGAETKYHKFMNDHHLHYKIFSLYICISYSKKLYVTISYMNYPQSQQLATAIPIQNISSFYHIYLVDFRFCFCCYKPYFKVKKENGNWVINRDGEEKSYTIPLHKNINQLNDVLVMIGLKNKIMKMKLIQEDKIIKTKHFLNLNSLFNNIIFTEESLNGVLYIK